MNKSVVILGTGLTLSKFETTEHNGSDVWAVGSAYPMLKDLNIVSTYFCLHTNETIDFDNVIDQKNYPLYDIIEKYNSRFFTNSISYVIAYALYKGYSKISIYGVDMDAGSEYAFERPSVTYWIGFARGLSVEVYIASNIDNPLFLYGFDNVDALVKRLDDRMNMSKTLGKECLDRGETDKGNQYIGQYFDNQHWLNELRG